MTIKKIGANVNYETCIECVFKGAKRNHSIEDENGFPMSLSKKNALYPRKNKIWSDDHPYVCCPEDYFETYVDTLLNKAIDILDKNFEEQMFFSKEKDEDSQGKKLGEGYKKYLRMIVGTKIVRHLKMEIGEAYPEWCPNFKRVKNT